MPSIPEAFQRLSSSKFRSSFHLGKKYLEQVRALGPEKLREHAVAFVRDKLSGACPVNDGRQTPMSGHPVFLAMHGCAMCCRGCMNKWWKVPLGVELTAEQQTKIVNFLLAWIERQVSLSSSRAEVPHVPPN